MNVMEIINPIIAIGGLGLLFGVGLGIASKKFAVPVDPRVDALKDHLPGANCGGCGFAGCDAFAKAVVNGEISPSGCPVSNAVQREGMAGVMGLVAEEGDRKGAIVRCTGRFGVAREKYIYEGVQSCTDAHLIQGGPKGCGYGFLGLVSCEKACPFDAIHIENGLAVVDKAKCVACGICVGTCPRKLIYVGSEKTPYQVQCMSHAKGKEVKEQCSAGCIGCGICVKQCEFDAIKLDNLLATIDASKCTACGKCVAKCPTKAIKALLGE